MGKGGKGRGSGCDGVGYKEISRVYHAVTFLLVSTDVTLSSFNREVEPKTLGNMEISFLPVSIPYRRENLGAPLVTAVTQNNQLTTTLRPGVCSRVASSHPLLEYAEACSSLETESLLLPLYFLPSSQLHSPAGVFPGDYK